MNLFRKIKEIFKKKRKPQSSNLNLFQYAIQEAKQAVALDHAKKYKEARIKYVEAAEILLEFMKYNKNPNLKQLCNNKIGEYIERARQLHNKRPKLKVDSENEEELSKEDQKLINSIKGTILVEKPDESWEDIIGLTTPKQALREAVILPVTHPELFNGVRKPWNGILIFGPSGSGKTMLYSATANEINSTFMKVDFTHIFSKWAGESEKLVKILFEVARRMAPTIIFIDEIDTMVIKRDFQNESGCIRRVKTQLLQEIKELKNYEGELVTIITATNRPWDIDEVFLPLFDKKIYVPLPDSESRQEIFKFYSRNVLGTENIDFHELSRITEGYSGFDISVLCKEAIMRPLRDLDQEGLLENNDRIEIRPLLIEDFIVSLEYIRATVDQTELYKFKKWSEENNVYQN
ncbi:MAG: ATP-binding protein [archaeon]|nr:ATP-binding protein [archaeon]